MPTPIIKDFWTFLFVLFLGNGWQTNWLERYFHGTPYWSMMKFSLTPVHFTKRRKLFGPLWEPEYAHPELPSWIKINWNEMKLVNSFGVTLAVNGTFKPNISGMWFVSRWQSEEHLRDCQKCTLSSYKLLCILKAWNENSHAIARPCNLKQKSRLIIAYTLKVCLIKAKIITLRNAFVRDFLATQYYANIIY